jgi:hypothetical protein
MARHAIVRGWLGAALAGGLAISGASCEEAELQAAQGRGPATRSQALTADEVCIDGDPACTPSGAHQKHSAYECKVCHAVAGRLSFQRTGPAYGAGIPPPAFDAAAKTCSNVACHMVPAGIYSFYFPGGDGEPELNVVSYGGAPAVTPSWYSTGTCTACHGNPPRTGAWHSGLHANQGPTGPANQCQFCHPDATSPGNGMGDSITDATLHRNGAVNVTPTFKSTCFGCH